MSTESKPEAFDLPSAEPSPPQPTPLERALEDEAFYKGLQKFVRRRVAHAEDAEDVLHLAVVRAIHRERHGEPWDPDGGTTAGLHLMKFIKGALANRQELKRNHPLDGVDDIDVFASGAVSPAEAVAERLVTAQCKRHASELQRELAATGKDPVVVGILESIEAGVVEHSEIAVRIGRTYAEVRLGFKRLGRYAQATVNAFRQQARFQ